MVLVCAMALALCACSAPAAIAKHDPKLTVTNYCEAMKDFDSAAMQACLTADAGSKDLTDDIPEEAAFLVEQVRVWAKDTTYKIIETQKNDGSATVTVYFTYKDASPVLTDTAKEFLKQAVISVFSGGSVDYALLQQLFTEKAQSATLSTMNETVTFNLVKTEENGWKISSVPNSVYDIATCNVTYGLGALVDVFA